MSTAIRSYLGKRDYQAYKAGTRRAGGSVPRDRRRSRYLSAPRSMPMSISSPYPAQLRVLGKEKKAIDSSTFVTTLSTTANISPINLIRVGSTFCNRIGRKIEMLSFKLDGQIIPTFVNTVYDYGRILVVYDRQPNGVLPSISDILQDTDQATANSTTAYSGANVNNVDRFQILRDHRIQLPSFGVTASQITSPGPQDQVTNCWLIDDYIKLRGLTTQYKADSSPAVIGDIASGALYLVQLSNVAAINAGYTTSLKWRLRYNDA